MHNSLVFRLIALDFTICTGMSGNGVKIFRTFIIKVRRLMEVPGKVVEIVITRCCVVVPGTNLRSIAVVPIVTSTRRTASGGAGVFA